MPVVFRRARSDVAGNDLWELGKMALVGLLSALGGGGLVRAFGQNRNEATAHTLTLLAELDERNKELARRIDEQAIRAVEQAQASGENRAKLAYLDLERTMQAQRIEGLADQVMLERRVREVETRTLTGERDMLLKRVVLLEQEAKNCHEMLDKQEATLRNQETMLQELRSIRDGQVVAATVHADVAERTAQLVAGDARDVAKTLASRVPPSVDANTSAVEAQTLATTENTEAVRRDTEARSDDT